MTALHEDDLRTFAAELRAAAVCAEASVADLAAGGDGAADYCAAVERAFDALRKLGTCRVCGGSGLIGDDVNCGCPAGDRYRAVPVAAPRPEVKG